MMTIIVYQHGAIHSSHFEYDMHYAELVLDIMTQYLQGTESLMVVYH